MSKYHIGEYVDIKRKTLENLDIDLKQLQVSTDYDFFLAKIVEFSGGRSYVVELGNGEQVTVGGRAFQKRRPGNPTANISPPQNLHEQLISIQVEIDDELDEDDLTVDIVPENDTSLVTIDMQSQHDTHVQGWQEEEILVDQTTADELRNRERYWQVSDWDGVEYNIGKFMSRNTFKRMMSSFKLPGNQNSIDDIWGNCKQFFRACAVQWQQSWSAGEFICVDETMFQWEGASAAMLSYIARKPHPVGFQCKTACCALSNIVLDFDLVEGQDIDGQKVYVGEWGKSTGTTLRITEFIHGTGRTVVGDSWFGSVNTALALKKHGLYFIGNVKNGYYGFPKAHMKERMTQRGDQMFMKRTWPLVNSRAAESAPPSTPTTDVFAAAHCDKQPTFIVGTRGKSTPGRTAVRTFRGFADGQVIKKQYELPQPHILELYRSHFNAIDVFNKIGVGADSLCHFIGTKVWWKRAFFGFVSMCETNAYLAYTQVVENISRLEFRERLGYALVRFGGYVSIVQEPSMNGSGHEYITWTDYHTKCVVCGRQTKCKCVCGARICNPARTKDGCYKAHILGLAEGTIKRKKAAKKPEEGGQTMVQIAVQQI